MTDPKIEDIYLTLLPLILEKFTGQYELSNPIGKMFFIRTKKKVCFDP